MLAWMIRGNVKSKGCELGVRRGAGLSPCCIPHPAALCYEPPPSTEEHLLGPHPSAAPPACAIPPRILRTANAPPQVVPFDLGPLQSWTWGRGGSGGAGAGQAAGVLVVGKARTLGCLSAGAGHGWRMGGQEGTPRLGEGEEEEQDGAVPLLPLGEGIKGGEGQITPPLQRKQ